MAFRSISRLVYNSILRSPKIITPSLLRPYPRLPRPSQPTARRFAHAIPKPPRLPPSASSSASSSAPSSESKPRKLLEPHYELTFTCVPCGGRSTHTISKQGYHKGSVLITCPSCRNRHVISDHLNIFGNRKITVEDLMREKGQLVKRGTLGEDGDVEFWEDGTVTERGAGAGNIIPSSTPSSTDAQDELKALAEEEQATKLRESRDPSSQSIELPPTNAAPLGNLGARPSVGSTKHTHYVPSTRRQYSKSKASKKRPVLTVLKPFYPPRHLNITPLGKVSSEADDPEPPDDPIPPKPFYPPRYVFATPIGILPPLEDEYDRNRPFNNPEEIEEQESINRPPNNPEEMEEKGSALGANDVKIHYCDTPPRTFRGPIDRLSRDELRMYVNWLLPRKRLDPRIPRIDRYGRIIRRGQRRRFGRRSGRRRPQRSKRAMAAMRRLALRSEYKPTGRNHTYVRSRYSTTSALLVQKRFSDRQSLKQRAADMRLAKYPNTKPGDMTSNEITPIPAYTGIRQVKADISFKGIRFLNARDFPTFKDIRYTSPVSGSRRDPTAFEGVRYSSPLRDPLGEPQPPQQPGVFGGVRYASPPQEPQQPQQPKTFKVIRHIPPAQRTPSSFKQVRFVLGVAPEVPPPPPPLPPPPQPPKPAQKKSYSPSADFLRNFERGTADLWGDSTLSDSFRSMIQESVNASARFKRAKKKLGARFADRGPRRRRREEEDDEEDASGSWWSAKRDREEYSGMDRW